MFSLCLLLVAAGGAGCARESAPPAPPSAACDGESLPNVLLITIDTLRADRLSCYGYKKHRTPNIDRLAAAGALFEQAFCDVTWTTPSMASVMTGTYATVHGFKSTKTNRLASDRTTLAEVLQRHGYATGAVVGSFPLHSRYHLDQGFDDYDDRFTNAKKTHRKDAEVTDAAASWLRRHSAGPFFLWAHYFGVHSNSDLHLTLEETAARYDPDVVRNDAHVGRLLHALDELGLSGKTLVVLHADHGESLWEHGQLGHGKYLYEPTLHIPLIMRYPCRIPAGTRVGAMARNVDIFPTVLDVLGLRERHRLSGSSLLPLIAPPGGRAAGRRQETEVYAETYLPAHRFWARQVRLADGTRKRVGLVRRGIRTARWKFIKSEPAPLFDAELAAPAGVPEPVLRALRTEELYDLVADPGEKHNVIRRYPTIATALRLRLQHYREKEDMHAPAPAVKPDAATEERLRSLGYAGD